jgi:hypothetical protein
MYVEDYGYTIKINLSFPKMLTSWDQIPSTGVGYSHVNISKAGYTIITIRWSQVRIYEKGYTYSIRTYKGRNYYQSVRDVVKRLHKKGLFSLPEALCS